MASNTNRSIQNDLRRSPPIEFPLFPKLSPEIRVEIWKLILYKPQVIAVVPDDDPQNIMMPQSPHCELRCVNRARRPLGVDQESRYEEMKVVLPCYTAFVRKLSTTQTGDSPVKREWVMNPDPIFHANLAADTIWIINTMGYDTLRGFSTFYVPKAGGGYTHNPVQSIAVSWKFWHDMVPFDYEKEHQFSAKRVKFLEMMRAISKANIDEDMPAEYRAEPDQAAKHFQELILVVGSEDASRKKGIVFVQPSEPPQSYLPLKILDKRYLSYPSGNDIPRATWNALNSEAEQFIRNYQKKKATEAQKLLNCKSSLEERKLLPEIELTLPPAQAKSGSGDNSRLLSREFTDPPRWKIPKISYMQATTQKRLDKLSSIA